MRPQFSLLTLLLLIPYAAVLAAAAADIFSVWTRIAIYALPAAFLIACAVAILGRGQRRVFACGMILGCLLYAAFSIVSLIAPDMTPHGWLALALPDPPASLEFHEDYDLYSVNEFLAKLVFATSQCTLAAGVAGGLIAVAMWPQSARDSRQE